ncbi:MAG: flagellar hook-associated protein FlgK [Terracidiphilus sp.]
MGTISSAFNLIAGALDADQSALNIVANNVANANTTGYTRETPNFEENTPIEINGVEYGAGVEQTGATSVRDRVLEERLMQQQQLASSSGSRLTALDAIQTIFTPDSGSPSSAAGDIGSDITSFFDSFPSLESDPTDSALRQQVLSTASTLAGDLSSAAASLKSQRASLDQEAAGVATQVNALTGAIAKLNQQIQSVSADGDAGTLEDQRQQDLSALSKLIGINQVTTENDGLSVTTASGHLLVSGAASFAMTTGSSGGVTHFFLNGSDVTTDLASCGGQLGGYLTARDQDIPSALSALDQLAYSISTAVNTQNNAGTDMAGDNGGAGNIFNAPTAVAGSALAMSVVMTDPDHIAAAASGAGTGDDSNAVALAGLATQTIVSGKTATDFFAQFVSAMGSTVSQVQTENTAQEASVTQLQSQRDALSSVNLNDEAASMQQLERSYQAASEVFGILNSIMASALNLGVQTPVS